MPFFCPPPQMEQLFQKYNIPEAVSQIIYSLVHQLCMVEVGIEMTWFRVQRNQVLSTGYTIRNYPETGWAIIPRYILHADGRAYGSYVRAGVRVIEPL